LAGLTGLGETSGTYWSSSSIVKISRCKVSGKITGEDYVGGLIGFNDAGIVSGCSVSADVTSIQKSGEPGNAAAGGLIGGNYSGEVSGCKFDGGVMGMDRVGGIVGDNWSNMGTKISRAGGPISDCTVNAELTGKEDVGGIVGSTGIGGGIFNCEVNGAVVGEQTVGGLVGTFQMNGEVSGCVMSGSVTGSREVGGLVGFRFGSVVNVNKCAFNGEVTGKEDVGALIGHEEREDNYEYGSLITGAENQVSPKARVNGHAVGMGSLIGNK
jgi:hypothetical protein